MQIARCRQRTRNARGHGGPPRRYLKSDASTIGSSKGDALKGGKPDPKGDAQKASAPEAARPSLSRGDTAAGSEAVAREMKRARSSIGGSAKKEADVVRAIKSIEATLLDYTNKELPTTAYDGPKEGIPKDILVGDDTVVSKPSAKGYVGRLDIDCFLERALEHWTRLEDLEEEMLLRYSPPPYTLLEIRSRLVTPPWHLLISPSPALITRMDPAQGVRHVGHERGRFPAAP